MNYGALTELAKKPALGETITCDYSQLVALRCAGGRHGRVFTIIDQNGEKVTLRRVAQTRWGINKARVAAMPVGAQTVVGSYKAAYGLYKGGQYCGARISIKRQANTSYLVTRTA